MFLAETSIQLVPDGTLLLHLLMIVIMVVVLNRTLLKPINEILANREKFVTGRISEAEEITAKAQDMLKEHQAGLRVAREEGYRLLEKERAEAVKERDQKLRLIKAEMTKFVDGEIATTRQQEAQVKQELEAQASSISALITTQILGKAK